MKISKRRIIAIVPVITILVFIPILGYATTAAEWNDLGNSYFDKGKFDKALDCYNKAIVIDPSAAHYFNRGNTFDELGRYREALSDFNSSITLDPNLAAAYISRGLTYSNLKEHENALADFTKAIDLDTKEKYKAYFDRGIAYYELGQKENAKADFKIACDLGLETGCERYREVTDGATLDIYGADTGKAIEYFKKANEYVQKNNAEKAIEFYTEAIKIQPNFHEAYYGRGASYYFLGKKNEAMKDWKKACDLGYEAGCERYELMQEIE
jgi:tetratricopeptide (TPR) repeat protein